MSSFTEAQQYQVVDDLIEGKGNWKYKTDKELQSSLKYYMKLKCYKIVHAIQALIVAKFTNAKNERLSYTYQITEIRKFKEKGGSLTSRSTQILLQQSNRFKKKGQDLIAVAFESAASRLSPSLPSHDEGDELTYTDAHFMLMRACLQSI
jgi:hypothetical protein